MLAIVLAVLAASSVWAAGGKNPPPTTSTLFTPPLYLLPAGFPESRIYTCDIVNVSATVRHVTIVLLDADGLPVPTAIQEVDLSPGQATSLLIRNTGEVAILLPGLHYCKFVVAGDTEDFRANMLTEMGGFISVPAR
jgi:hypothetical protein